MTAGYSETSWKERKKSEREIDKKKEVANLMTEKTRQTDRQTDRWVDLAEDLGDAEKTCESFGEELDLKREATHLIFLPKNCFLCWENEFFLKNDLFTNVFCLHNAERCDFNRNFSISSNRTAARFQLVENAPQSEIVCWNRASKRYLSLPSISLLYLSISPLYLSISLPPPSLFQDKKFPALDPNLVTPYLYSRWIKLTKNDIFFSSSLWALWCPSFNRKYQVSNKSQKKQNQKVS